jgi:predicted nucleotidyltransferase
MNNTLSEELLQRDKIACIIKEICIHNGYHIKQLLLFGSRIRKDYREDSDWDFLAVLDKPVNWKDKMKLWLDINRKLSHLNMEADVVFKSEAEYVRDKNDTGKVTYYAQKEGIII